MIDTLLKMIRWLTNNNFNSTNRQKQPEKQRQRQFISLFKDPNRNSSERLGDFALNLLMDYFTFTSAVGRNSGCVSDLRTRCGVEERLLLAAFSVSLTLLFVCCNSRPLLGFQESRTTANRCKGRTGSPTHSSGPCPRCLPESVRPGVWGERLRASVTLHSLSWMQRLLYNKAGRSFLSNYKAPVP